MNNQNYEDYMRSVLGYSPYVEDNYTYTEQEDFVDNSGNQITTNMQTQDLNEFYPEIYRIVYPMVCKVCNINSKSHLTNELLDQMTDEIYRNVEPEDDIQANSRTVKNPPLKNGDVINPNAKEPEIQQRETRQTNFLLRDLIRILLLREWERPQRPPTRPPMGPVRPGMPPRPGRPPMSPPQRPRYY